jgi:hypothetical protein
MKSTIFTLLVMALMLVSCGPSEEEIALQLAEAINKTVEVYTLVPSNTAYPTHTPAHTSTPFPTYTSQNTPTTRIVTRIVIVTETKTATPLHTPTITDTPTATLPPTATEDPLQADKHQGIYLVGVDIAPGVWRSTGSGDDCYWEITRMNGSIINNHYGMAGGTMYIAPSAFQVSMEYDCGDWTFLQGP